MMANQCRTEMRWARPPDGLVSGTSLDMIHTVIAAARQHWQFVGRHTPEDPGCVAHNQRAMHEVPSRRPKSSRRVYGCRTRRTE